MYLNKVFLIGRLTQDPQLKTLPSGQSVATFGLATNRYFIDKSGQKQERTEFHNIVLFGKLADVASSYLRKGSLALIEGRIRTRSWQDNNNQRRTKTEIVAERLQLGPKVGSPREEAAPTPPAEEEIPVIEEEGNNQEIDIKDIPF